MRRTRTAIIALIIMAMAPAGLRGAGPLIAVKAGRVLDPGFAMPGDVIEAAKAKGIWLCGTELSREAWAVYGSDQPCKGVIDRLKRAHRLGLPMAFGSDLIVDIPGYRRGPAALTLLQSWLDAGIPAGDILKAMTSDAARMLRLEKSRGAVRAGFFADLIAVEGDRLADVLTLRKVRFVMKDGLVRKGPGQGGGE